MVTQGIGCVVVSNGKVIRQKSGEQPHAVRTKLRKTLDAMKQTQLRCATSPTCTPRPDSRGELANSRFGPQLAYTAS